MSMSPSLLVNHRIDILFRKANVLNLASAPTEKLQDLISACDAAPFGRGNQTVMDESYRKALKLDTVQFSIPFDLSGTKILSKIQRDLVDTHYIYSPRSVRTELYKLNIYGQYPS